VSRQSQQIVDLSGTSHIFTLRKDLRLAEKSTVAMVMFATFVVVRMIASA